MQLIIDGHNLIPHVPGISLSDLDDEDQLISQLMAYCRVKRCRAQVFFDQAPPGMSGSRSYGAVTANFVPQGRTADQAIMAYLGKLRKAARNYKIVTSDRQIIAAARSFHAEVISSAEFAKEMLAASETHPSIDPRNRALSEEEVNAWEALFKTRRKSK